MKESPESLNTQAIEFASHGEYSEAIACFKRAISIERTNYLLWYNLGLTYRDAGDLNRAKDALLKAYTIEDEDDEVLETLALICFNRGECEEALQYCLEGLSLNQGNAHIWNTLGVIYYNRSIFDMACESFEQAITINPYYYDALYNLRDTYDELGNKTGMAICEEQMRHCTPGGQDA